MTRSSGAIPRTVRPVQVGDGIIVPLSFDGDLAVPPAAGGRGVPAAIRDPSERWLFDARAPQQVVLRGGFTTKGVNARVYHPLYGLTFVPGVTPEFRKALELAPFRRHVEALGARVLARDRGAAVLARRPLASLRVRRLVGGCG